MATIIDDARRVFWQMGTCSRTFFYLMNREFGNESEIDEQAADPLAGGILAKGHQCGMLWGAVLAAGREANRRYADESEAVATAIAASEQIAANFAEYAGEIDCRAITRTNFANPISMAAFLLLKTRSCFDLAAEWAPEAADTLREALEPSVTDAPLSCATTLLKRIGADREEAVSVAGLAGGIGLSGSGCGALGAAVWKGSKTWCRENPTKLAFKNRFAKNLVKAFKKETGAKLSCREICGRSFETPEEHAEFIRSFGCSAILDFLARSLQEEMV